MTLSGPPDGRLLHTRGTVKLLLPPGKAEGLPKKIYQLKFITPPSYRNNRDKTLARLRVYGIYIRVSEPVPELLTVCFLKVEESKD